jgi:hypothetical protein
VKKFAPLLFIFATLPATAQTSFLGIPLDDPFPGSMKGCPKAVGMNMVDHNLIKDGVECYFEDSPHQYTIWNGPDLGIGHLLKVSTYEDKPIFFKFSFNKAAYGKAIDIFTTRYGKPQKASRETVRTGGGESFDSRTNIWENPKLRIQLDEIGKDVRWSDAVIVNLPLANSMVSKSKEGAKAAAEKL